MISILIVGLGGFIGASSRYFIANFVQGNIPKTVFPFGTIVVNLIGCLLIGFLVGYLESKNLLTENVKLFLIIGILGGFTTFSAFGIETLNLVNKGHLLFAFNYVTASVVLGLGSVWFGHYLAKVF